MLGSLGTSESFDWYQKVKSTDVPSTQSKTPRLELFLLKPIQTLSVSLNLVDEIIPATACCTETMKEKKINNMSNGYWLVSLNIKEIKIFKHMD